MSASATDDVLAVQVHAPSSGSLGVGLRRETLHAPMSDEASGRQQKLELTLFVNQLPFTATKEDVVNFFVVAAGQSADFLERYVRLVYRGEKFSGTAFVDTTVPSSSRLENSRLR